MSVPTKLDAKGRRIYGAWAGNPAGVPEDPAGCVEEVWPTVGWQPHQCYRKRGHGRDKLFCKQHGKKHHD